MSALATLGDFPFGGVLGCSGTAAGGRVWSNRGVRGRSKSEGSTTACVRPRSGSRMYRAKCRITGGGTPSPIKS